MHLIEYAASKKGILLDGYMSLQQNDNVSFISISRYIGLPPELGLFHPVEGAFLSYFSKEAVRHCDAMIFNSYEDAMMIMTGEERYSKMRIFCEMYVSEMMNGVYSSGSIRIYHSVCE